MHKITSSYKFIRLSPDNIEDVCTIFKDVYNRDVSVTILQNKFGHSSLSAKYLGFIAYNETDYPVAFSGAIPQMFRYQNKREIAAQLVDAMTNHDYAGRGLFCEIERRLDDLLVSKKISFFYGFPNQNSEHPLFEKMGWQTRTHMKRFHLQVKTIPFSRIIMKVPAIKSLYAGWRESILSMYNSDDTTIKHSAADLGWVSACHDQSYFEYKKFLDGRIIKVSGCNLWVKVGSSILIGDLEMQSENIMKSALNELKNIAFKLGITQIIFQCSQNNDMVQVFEKYVTPEQSWAIGYKNFSSKLPLEKLCFSYSDLDTF